ncbi:unnamed protein product [Brachionus calyciflorus]|uniref:RNA polymerase II subunit B1 CTD phosphatase RPAP2 homolog n=1 Tax=Brachionus calyciflorus TaxID=104777 RepID=A0A814PGS3_9BILA|nr:unnamed protein product [Brachionus calyciflorus]
MDKKLQEKQFYLNNAEKIVSKLSSETLNEKETAQFIKQIEPYHYEEIVEERFVSKLCGYPCCANELTKVI